MTVVVAEKWEMSLGTNRNIVTRSPLQNAAAILLGDVVTADATETSPDAEMISVSGSATEIRAKRKRGRPPEAGVAMTATERSRRYRRRRSGMWGMRRVELWVDTVSKLEQLAADNGYRIEAVVDLALAGVSKDYWRDLMMDRFQDSKDFIHV